MRHDKQVKQMKKEWKIVVKTVIKIGQRVGYGVTLQERTFDGVVFEDLLEKLPFKLGHSCKGLGKEHSQLSEEQMQRPRASLVHWGNRKKPSE